MADINRSQFLPAEISAEIIAQAQTDSAVMALARRINIPGRGVAVPVITGDPDAAWVAETGVKPVSNSPVQSKLLQPYKLAVIETVSMELTRDAKALYEELKRRLPRALATKFDATVLGGTAPGSNFDTFTNCTSQAITATTAYTQLVAADADVSAHGGIVNGFAISPQMRGKLLEAVDTTGRPLFINSVAEGAIPVILGSRTELSRGMYVAGSPNKAGAVGDWTQAIVGVVDGIQISVSDQATLTTSSGSINLWQQNMVAIRAEIEIGFRANLDCFNVLTLA